MSFFETNGNTGNEKFFTIMYREEDLRISEKNYSAFEENYVRCLNWKEMLRYKLLIK